ADHAPRVRVVQEQKREPDARKENEQRRREEEDGNRQQTGRHEERSPDDPAAPEDARHVDRVPGPVPRALAIVALDLAPQAAQDERPGRDHEESEETEPVGEPAPDDGPRDEMEE